MKAQYEQICNATVLKTMDVPVMKSLKKKHAEVLEKWLNKGRVIDVNYPDITASILERIVDEQINKNHNFTFSH